MDKIKPEDYRRSKLSNAEVEKVGDVYKNFYNWRSYRSGVIRHFRNTSFEDYLTLSRELFWNSISTNSDDLKDIGLDFSIPFARKEVMDFLGRITSLQIKPRIHGDDMDSLGIKVLQGMYRHWEFKSNQKVERFWESLYGTVNGTVCSYIGYNQTELERRYLTSYNRESGEFAIKKEREKVWDDVTKTILPIEDIYVPKIYERNIQKQGRLLHKTQMDEYDFHAEYDELYDDAKYVVPGYRIAEDSLYYRLLGGSGVTSTNKIEVIKQYDWIADEYMVTANGMWLNRLGKGDKPVATPMPFDHKMAPFTWGITGPLDNNLCYGVSIPFQVKDPHKILNTSYCVTPDTKILTRDLRWVEAGSLNVGDKLMGFDEFGKQNPKKAKGRGSKRQRHHAEAVVTNTGRMMAPVYEVTLEDGTVLKCTPNHRWLVWNWQGHGCDWLRTDEMEETMIRRDGELYLPKYFDVIHPESSYESGYIAGMFDGEGSLSLGTSVGDVSRGVQASFCQQDNEALKKTTDYLSKKGFDYKTCKKKPVGELEPTYQTYIRGGFKEVMRLLMQTRPERLIRESWGKKKISDMILAKQSLVKVISVKAVGEKEIITLESSTKTYIAEGFGAHNTMMVERELRAIDPPILTSDIDTPQLIFGQHKVIPVNDVNAYKEMKISEPSGQYFQMMNSLQANMSSQSQGGDTDVIPSRQPKAAREIMSIEKMKQQAMANALVMYYDLLRQEVLLVLKTALQFYPMKKYKGADKHAMNILVSDMPLSTGGIGNLRVRIVDKAKDAMELFTEAIKESATSGKQTEIVEVPKEVIKNMEFIITDIELEPESSSEIEKANFVENVITPMLNVYVPAGLADMGKVMLRHVEKLGENISDFASDAVLSKITGKGTAQATVPALQDNRGPQNGNLLQSLTGVKYGAENAGPIPQ